MFNFKLIVNRSDNSCIFRQWHFSCCSTILQVLLHYVMKRLHRLYAIHSGRCITLIIWYQTNWLRIPDKTNARIRTTYDMICSTYRNQRRRNIRKTKSMSFETNSQNKNSQRSIKSHKLMLQGVATYNNLVKDTNIATTEDCYHSVQNLLSSFLLSKTV
jgi:hypothetical protein